MLYTKDNIYTIIPEGWKSGANVERVGITFAKSWGFSITLDILNLPDSWWSFAQCINGEISDNPELLSANIRGAACLEDEVWGGLILKKR